MRVFDADAARLHPPYSPRCGSEQKDIARETLDCEVFVYGADDGFFGFRDDKVIRVFGNGAAGCDCRQPRAAAAANDAVDLIPMEKRATAAALCRNAFG